ncbi:MAG TPA: hypothetical protein ENJ95_09125 [Bacteroidetes bacterium]|nr:hypothetical protein [Bacteroidota bacterium]
MPNKISVSISTYARQFAQTLPLHLDAIYFIKKHQPWRGMKRYRWMARALLGAAILLGFFFFKDAFLQAKEAIGDPQKFGASISSFWSGFSFEKMDWALHGSVKYLVLIVLEIFTFHFIQRALEIQTGRKPNNSFKAFVTAEKRMVKASFIAYVSETILRIVAKTLLGIFGLNVLLGQPVSLLIQFYFLGFLILDNYHECFGLTLKESRKRTKKVLGAALAVGGVAYILMYVPLVGVVAASMIGAVTAAYAMERFAPLSGEGAGAAGSGE